MIFDNIIEKKEKLPLLSYISQAARRNDIQNFYQIDRKRRLSYLVYRSPEAMLVVDGHARDICGKFHFEPVNNNSSGKIKVRRADNFVQKTRYKENRLSAVKDALITGEGFLFISEIAKQLGDSIAQEFRKIDASFSDDYFRARGLIPVSSASMAVNHNDFEITGYTQTLHMIAGGTKDKRDFPKDKIVHVTFDKPAGRVEGWTPLFTVPLHLELLWLLWNNQYDFQEKGNHPDLIVTAEQLNKNKPAYEKVAKDLQSYNMPGSSKHGTLLLSGDKFNINQLERMDSLQFKEVGMAIQTLVAGLFQYPQSRLGIKTEQAAKAKDSSGGNEKFYYNLVEQKQDLLTDIENFMFWEPYFGVKLVPDKSYKHDQVEEGTAQQIRVGNLNTTMQQLNSYGMKLNTQKILDIYNGVDTFLCDKDLEEGHMQMMPQSTMNNRLGNDDATGSGMTSQDRAEKRTNELQREKVDGKPNGVTR